MTPKTIYKKISVAGAMRAARVVFPCFMSLCLTSCFVLRSAEPEHYIITIPTEETPLLGEGQRSSTATERYRRNVAYQLVHIKTGLPKDINNLVMEYVSLSSQQQLQADFELSQRRHRTAIFQSTVAFFGSCAQGFAGMAFPSLTSWRFGWECTTLAIGGSVLGAMALINLVNDIDTQVSIEKAGKYIMRLGAGSISFMMLTSFLVATNELASRGVHTVPILIGGGLTGGMLGMAGLSHAVLSLKKLSQFKERMRLVGR